MCRPHVPRSFDQSLGTFRSTAPFAPPQRAGPAALASTAVQGTDSAGAVSGLDQMFHGGIDFMLSADGNRGAMLMRPLNADGSFGAVRDPGGVVAVRRRSDRHARGDPDQRYHGRLQRPSAAAFCGARLQRPSAAF